MGRLSAASSICQSPVWVPAASAPAAPGGDAKIHVVPSPAQDSQLAMAKQMAKMVAEAKENLDKSLRQGAGTAIAEEMTVVRLQLDAQLHDAVEKAIKVSMERVSESTVKKVVQQAAERTASIVEEARKASETNAETLDAKVRQAVQDAVSGAAEQAAQQAAQQTAAQNLKHAVEDAVERAISGREAKTPSLEILSSPEAAQRHLNDWKRSLEETAQTVRSQTVEQTNAEAAAASKRWQEQFESALNGATEKISGKLSEASQTALTQAEQDIAARSAGLRSSLDDVIAGAQTTIQSLGAGIEQQRARAEETKAHLQEAAHSTIEQTRRKLDDLLSAQHEEMARKADQVIAERAQQIEPTLEAAARKAAERLSGQLDQTLTPKLEQVQYAVSQLANAEQQAAQLKNALREQVQQTADQAMQIQDAVREQVRQASQQAAQIQSTVREQVQQASQQALQESLERLKEETAKYPAEIGRAHV
jgi:hypothetical protein